MAKDLLIYGQLARFYDAQYGSKDYGSEVRRLEQIARQFGRSGGTTWLDVACGTGKHLEILRRRHECVGVDASAPMLRIARGRLPGLRLVRGDMRSFRLGRTFDVVTCLFSAIGHLSTERDVERAFRTFARHLKPGGVVMVEPWLSPSQARPGHLHLVTIRDPKVTLVRLAHSKIRGPRTVIQYCYLLGEAGRGIRVLKETHRGLMLGPRDLQRLLRAAGLRPRYFAKGLTADRGLLVGVKPTPGRTSRSPRGSPSRPRKRTVVS